MQEPLVTIPLILLTLLAAAAWAVALVRLRRADPDGRLARRQRQMVWVCTAGSALLLAYQLGAHERWQPLQAHVDGLLIIATLLGAVVLYLQHPSRLPGVSAFGLPVLAIVLAWAICSSAWTLQFFDIDSVWKTVHLASVYLGTVFFAVAAIAGGLFLYAQHRLRTKDLSEGGKLPSLERIERLIIHTSALGFAVLTLGLVTGLVIVSAGPTRLGDGWWHSPKVVLAAAVWLIYALVMNVRHATTFRGARAAWLSITGLVLLLATFGIATALPPIERATGKGTDERLHRLDVGWRMADVQTRRAAPLLRPPTSDFRHLPSTAAAPTFPHDRKPSSNRRAH